MAKKVFNMQGGYHSAAALSAFLNAAFAGKVAQGLNITETGSTGLNVLVQPGTGQIDTGQGFSRVIQVDDAEVVALSAASPSSPRRDLIVAYIDSSVTPTTSVLDNINDILKLAAVAGTPAATPTDPSGSTIQSAIGAGNPYIVLGRVRVAQAATSLTNSVIDDLRELALITSPEQLSDGIIDSQHIATSAVTTPKLADGAVTGAKLADGAVTGAKLADGAVTGAKMSVGWQSYTPTVTGFSVLPPGAMYRYMKIGTTVWLTVYMPSNGTSNSTTLTISLPFPAASVGTAWTSTGSLVVNGGSVQTVTTLGIGYITGGSSVMECYTTIGGGAWTASGGKRLSGFTITYESAT